MAKSKAPAHTFEEARFLRKLASTKARVRVKMMNGEEVEGYIEYWDQAFVRVTREPEAPNLFIFKHDISYIAELGE
ncbi:MAG: RNA chaperone Hfq [Acidobacteriota bacterium]